MGIGKIIPKPLKNGLKRILTINVDTRSIYRVPDSALKRQFEGKAAVVTGGAGGIGRAICIRLAVEGAFVYVCGRTKATVDSVVEEIHSYGGKAEALPLDITKYDDVCEQIGSVLRNSKLDFLVNCAGGGSRNRAKPFIEQDMGVVEEIIGTNLMGTINMCRACIPYMIDGGGGW